jgi:hypothetical protein
VFDPVFKRESVAILSAFVLSDFAVNAGWLGVSAVEVKTCGRSAGWTYATVLSVDFSAHDQSLFVCFSTVHTD